MHDSLIDQSIDSSRCALYARAQQPLRAICAQLAAVARPPRATTHVALHIYAGIYTPRTLYKYLYIRSLWMGGLTIAQKAITGSHMY